MKVIKASNIDDQQLLDGILNANTQAIKKIYDLALPSVISWVKENNGSEADGRDVFQEALIALFRKVEKGDFTLTCTLKSFLRIMCRNLWLSRLRNKQNQMSPLDNVEKVDLDEDLESRLGQSEKEQLFFKHFDQLGDNCRKIMQWFFDKISLKEIAARLDTSENYVKKRKFICKEKLIKAIQSDPHFEELKS
jgi:RNA polymerase sigma factor (sigma-70 family)